MLKIKQDKAPIDNPDVIDNNMLLGIYKGQAIGISLNNEKVNRTTNTLLLGGTGTGKTFKFFKPQLLQENASVVITDPSGDIFTSFAPYLIQRGYNVYVFNVSNPSISNHYNPLLNVYDANGNISEQQVDVLVSLYIKNAKAGKEAGSTDPFWEQSEIAFMTALIYYILENDDIPKEDKCFATILDKVQMAKISEDESDSALTKEMNAWFDKVGISERDKSGGGKYKTKFYYDTFLIAPSKTANTILVTTAVDLQKFATESIARITRENISHKHMNINFDKIATEQSYIFLIIPQAHQAYNFLISMFFAQLYARLYELGERGLRDKWHIGWRLGLPVFAPFNTKDEAYRFFEMVTEDNIRERDYINGTKIYELEWNGYIYKVSLNKESLINFVNNIDKMVIYSCGEHLNTPQLPIHVSFFIDEFKNITEIPNFLTILATSRKYRISSTVGIQDIGQIKTMYPNGEHETLLANTDITVFLGSNLIEDKEFIQKSLKKTTIRQISTSTSKSGSSTSYTPTEVPLMSIDEIEAINQDGRDDELVIIRDVAPILCQKLNLTKHKRWFLYKELSDKEFDLNRYFKNDNISSDTYK